MDDATPADLIIREPRAAEATRALGLFEHLLPPAEAWLLVGVREQPIQRFVAASAAWMKGDLGQWRLACRPGVARRSVAGPFIDRMEQVARSTGTRTLEYADLLADDNNLCALLQEKGYECRRSERFFEVPTLQAHERVMRIAASHLVRAPGNWCVESIRQHSPKTVAELVGQHRLLPLAELRRYWRADVPFGFDLDLSSILFDGRQPVGTLLLRRSAETYIVDVRVVKCDSSRLRALGNLFLFRHLCQHGDPRGPIRWLQFRAGETEHRETAQLALRMGGRELPPRRILGKQL